MKRLGGAVALALLLAACGVDTQPAPLPMPTFPPTLPPQPTITATFAATATSAATAAGSDAPTPAALGDLNAAQQATVVIPPDVALATAAPTPTAPRGTTTAGKPAPTLAGKKGTPAPTLNTSAGPPPDNAAPVNAEPAHLDWLQSDITRHTAPLTTVALSPDDQMLASGGRDMTIRIWNMATGKATNLPLNHIAAISALAFSPDSRMLASASDDHTLRLWPVQNDAIAPGDPPLLEGHTMPVTAIGFSPDSQTLISGAGYSLGGVGKLGEVRLWDVTKPAQPAADFRIFATPDAGPVLSVAVTNTIVDSAYIGAVGAAGSLTVWKITRTGRNVAFQLRPASNGLRWAALAFSPDNRVLAADNSGNIHILDTSGAEQSLLTAPDSTAQSPDSVRLAISSEGRNYAVTTFGANGGRTVTLWDATNGQSIGRITDPQPGATVVPRALAFSHGADRFLVATDNATIRTYALTDPATATRTWPGVVAPAASVALATNGSAIALNPWTPFLRAVGAGSPALRNLASGTTVTQVPIGAQGSRAGVAVSPDSATIASADNDGTIRLWRGGGSTAQQSGRLAPGGTVGGPAQSIAWAADGSLLAASYSATSPVTIVWDVRSQGVVAVLKTDGAAPSDAVRVVFAGNSRRIIVGGPSGIVLWDITRKAKLGAVDTGHSDLQTVGLSSDGTLAAVATQGGVVSVWKLTPLLALTSGAAISPIQLSPVTLDRNNVLEDSVLTIQSPDFRVTSLALAPNHRYLAIGTSVRAVEVWDLQTAQMTRLPCVSATADIAWAADNSHVVIADQNGGLLSWRLSLPGLH